MQSTTINTAMTGTLCGSVDSLLDSLQGQGTTVLSLLLHFRYNIIGTDGSLASTLGSCAPSHAVCACRHLVHVSCVNSHNYVYPEHLTARKGGMSVCVAMIV